MELTCGKHPDRAARARCVECGNALCFHCRVRVDGRNWCRGCVPAHLKGRVPGRRSPLFASILSVVPGLGQLYAGAASRALVFGGSAIALAAHPNLIPFPVPLFLYVFNMFDAWTLAEERNARVAGDEAPPNVRRQRRFWGLFAGGVAAFAAARTTIAPHLSPDLLWPCALGLYGAFLLFDRSTNHVRTA